jgi:hypothetical protein
MPRASGDNAKGVRRQCQGMVDQKDERIDQWEFGRHQPGGDIDERFIDAPSVMGLGWPSMNCDVERALAACHGGARHYGDFSVMRKQ